MKILLVEDDANLREVTQRSLEKERYVVEIAADYRTALQKIEDYDYDCILLDIMLPDGSGLDLLEKLKEMHKRENVIILSAKDSIEDKVLGLEELNALLNIDKREPEIVADAEAPEACEQPPARKTTDLER